MFTKHAASATATVDFTLADNGTATGTITFTDAAGYPTTAMPGATVATTLVTSNPALGATIDSTGLVIALAPVAPLPTPLPTDLTVTATINITNPAGTTPATVGPITATNAQGIDLVDGGPFGASISLS
jgi:hypothetical protein